MKLPLVWNFVLRRSAAQAVVLLLACASLRAADSPGVAPADPRQRFKAYREAMAQPGPAAAAAVPAAAPADTALVAGVAEAYRRNPKLVDELLAEYGAWHDDGRGTPVVKRPKRLAPAHTTETCRAAWEFLLLAPPTPEILFMETGPTITDALAAIGNPASIPVLQLALRRSAGEPQPHDDCGALQRQFQILVALSEFRSPAGLQSLLEATDQATARAGAAPLRVNGRTLKEWPAQLIAGGTAAQRQQWRTTLQSFRQPGVPASLAPRVRELEAALDAAER